MKAVISACAVILLTAAPASAITSIPGEEITSWSPGTGRDSSHLIAVNVSSHTNPKLSLQRQINVVRAKGGLAILPHPSGSRGAPGFSLATMRNLYGYTGVELTLMKTNAGRYYGYDYGGASSPVYSQYATRGAPVWGFRNPDIHKLSETARRAGNVVIAPNASRFWVVDALRRGSFYTTRVAKPARSSVLRSFPIPTVDPSGKINVTVYPGYSVRIYDAFSDTPLTATCSSRDINGAPLIKVKNMCANTQYAATMSYQPTGGEGYVKITAIKYSDTYRWPNAMYQPIYVGAGGVITYNPYAATSPVSNGKFLGAIHVHTNRSKDAPRGASPRATRRWFAKRGYDWIVITDHNRVTRR